MKRTINFVSKTYTGFRTYSSTVSMRKVKITKLTKPMIKTDLGYVDITVVMDRWGRLKQVEVERSKPGL